MTAADLIALWEAGAGCEPVWRGARLVGDGPLDEVDTRLLELYASLFGPRISLLTVCPGCGETLSAVVPVGALAGEPGPRAGVVDSVEVRVPTVADLAAAASAGEDARRVLCERCAAGPVDEAAFARWLEAEHPRLAPSISQTCPGCGEHSEHVLDPAEFVWEQVRARAERLLDEVATLAAAFGWTDDEILSMSTARRHAFLERVA
jgi:hypothetical protein